MRELTADEIDTAMVEAVGLLGSGRPLPDVLGRIRARGNAWQPLAEALERMVNEQRSTWQQDEVEKQRSLEQLATTADPAWALRALFPGEARRGDPPLAGTVVTGLVTMVDPLGVFIDLGGYEGFLSAREMVPKPRKHADEPFSQGDEVEVRVLSVEASDLDPGGDPLISVTQRKTA